MKKVAKSIGVLCILFSILHTFIYFIKCSLKPGEFWYPLVLFGFLVGGIGMIKCKNWARLLIIYLSVFLLIPSFLLVVLVFLFVDPWMLRDSIGEFVPMFVNIPIAVIFIFVLRSKRIIKTFQ